MTDKDFVSPFDIPSPSRPEKGISLFSTSGNRQRDAIIGNYHINWDVYCSGYWQAADVLVDHFLQKHDNYSAEYESKAFPIIFLYRHYLELRLKELFIAYGRLLGDSVDIPGHGLVSLWKEIRDRANREPSEHVPEINEDMEVLEGIIEQFERIDPKSVVFRYPISKDGKTVTLPKIQVDLQRLKEVMDWVSFFMDGWSVGVDEYISAKYKEAEI